MKLLVIAATGNLGKAIVNAALRDGHNVSVLVRDGTKVPWNGEQLTKVYVAAMDDGLPGHDGAQSRRRAQLPPHASGRAEIEISRHRRRVDRLRSTQAAGRHRRVRRRRLTPLRGRRPGLPRRRRGVGEEGCEEQVQQGPGRVQGRRRDVLLRALHDDAHRLPLRLSTQLTPAAPGSRPREERLQRVDDQAIRTTVERVVVAAVRECHELRRGQ